MQKDLDEKNAKGGVWGKYDISDVDVMIRMQNTVSLYDCLLLYIRNEHKSRKEK